jgi:uncharacterized protein
MYKPRVVIDTGVVVSAVLLPHSVPRQAFETALASAELLISEETITELSAVLRRPKFNKYISEEHRLEFLSALVKVAVQVDIKDTIAACRDPKDDKFLELAVSGGATYILTGDEDLLTLNPYRGIHVSTPGAFLTYMLENG